MPSLGIGTVWLTLPKNSHIDPTVTDHLDASFDHETSSEDGAPRALDLSGHMILNDVLYIPQLPYNIIGHSPSFHCMYHLDLPGPPMPSNDGPRPV